MILDKSVCGKNIKRVLIRALKGGVDIVQLRDKFSPTAQVVKEGKILFKIAQKYKVPFIINDRLDAALALNCDGLHLGQDDISINTARKALGNNKIIGLSCHSISDIKKAQNEQIDYCGFGPIFKTKTKPNVSPRGLALMKKGLKISKVPVFSIGGIDKNNLSEVQRSGAKRIAICRDICLAKNIIKTTKQIKLQLTLPKNRELV